MSILFASPLLQVPATEAAWGLVGAQLGLLGLDLYGPFPAQRGPFFSYSLPDYCGRVRLSDGKDLEGRSRAANRGPWVKEVGSLQVGSL